MSKKRIIYIILLIAGLVFTTGAGAQNRKISFYENDSWQNVVGKAKEAHRIIFMDCYTTWCGPCKMLDRDVFTNDQIADFYNENFINAKYDMEKGEGITLMEKYGVSAFPTLLFIDPATEEVIHRVAGAGSVEYMMEQARIATDPAVNMKGIKDRYEAGEKNAKTLSEYISVLRRASMSTEINNVTVEYLSGLTDEQMMIETNRELFESNVIDPLSEPSLRVFSNRKAFGDVVGKQRVDQKLGSILMIAVNKFRNKEPEPVDNFDQERYDALISLLSRSDDKMAPFCLIQLQTAGYAQYRQYDKMIEAVRTAVKQDYPGLEQLKSIYVMTYLTKLFGREDKQLQKKAKELVDFVIDEATDPSDKLPYYQIKAIMLESYGDTEGAEKAKAEIIKLREKGAGPRMMKMG
ncbi:MAG: thioredoxin domain-containing protein [Bacteroidales bacterium]|nr:thioredoxin domain-containing protein [Bacteroidales bacterium]MDD3988688.1 thioredoxin domain-containing protein [Bacteroidales bacterium]